MSLILNVTFKPFVLSVVLLSVIMLIVIMLSVAMLTVVKLNVVMLNVVMLCVVAPFFLQFVSKNGMEERNSLKVQQQSYKKWPSRECAENLKL